MDFHLLLLLLLLLSLSLSLYIYIYIVLRTFMSLHKFSNVVNNN